jgi:hypothetical protein
MTQDLVDISNTPDWLVIAVGIEAEPADELIRVEVKDADVALGRRRQRDAPVQLRQPREGSPASRRSSWFLTKVTV